MSPDSGSIRSAAADAVAAPLDLLLTDAAVGALRRVNPGGSGLRLAAALVASPWLVAGRGGQSCRVSWPASRWARRRCSRPGATAGSPIRAGRAIRCCAGPCRCTWLLQGPRKVWWPTPGWIGRIPNALVSSTNLIDGLAPSNNPLLNPAD